MMAMAMAMSLPQVTRLHGRVQKPLWGGGEGGGGITIMGHFPHEQHKGGFPWDGERCSRNAPPKEGTG